MEVYSNINYGRIPLNPVYDYPLCGYLLTSFFKIFNTIRNHKFTIEGITFKLEVIDENGDATYRSVDFQGRLTDKKTMKCAEFLKEFSPATGKKDLEIAEYPIKRVGNNIDWEHLQYKSMVIMALNVVNEKYGNPDVVCRITPKAALANTKFKANELVLVPVTTRVKVVKEDESESQFTCEGDHPDGQVLELCSLLSKDMPIPAWFATSCTDPKEANLKISMIAVNVDVGIDKKKTTSEKTTIAIPVLVNKTAVKEGQELKYHRPVKADKGVKRPFDVV